MDIIDESLPIDISINNKNFNLQTNPLSSNIFVDS